ncbi:MAG: DUF1214 domain-containing protein [Bacteroidales bacterium]|nr:DUF1214 domain-containing protein [Bacteroidales bacterium]
MRRLLFSFLRILAFFQKLRIRLPGGRSRGLHRAQMEAGKAWADYCDQLRLAGASLMYPGAPRDPLNQAEGIRYLSRLMRAGLEAFVEYGDPGFPVFRHTVHETIKMGADNPDNVYLNAQINGKNEYRITGRRNTIHYIGFFTQNGQYGTTGGLAPCGALEGSSLKTDAQGNFEIILSKEPKGQNWLKIDDETSLVMVRQTFYDRWNETPAELTITNLNGKSHPDPVTLHQMAEGLKNAALLAGGASLLFARWSKDFQKHTNRLPQFDPEKSNAAGGDAGIIYYHSHWKLAPDEALVIEVMPPACASWNFQLNNYWMESLDYRYFTICINKHSAVYRSDGSVQVVVSHRDPGVPNWINTCSHPEGTMCWRWYRLAEGAKAVEPSCRVVKAEHLTPFTHFTGVR